MRRTLWIKMIWLLLLFPCLNLSAQEAQADSIAQAYAKGLELLATNQYDQALPYIFECQRTDPKNPDYLHRLGYCYAQLGNYRDAKYAFKALLEVNDQSVPAYNNLAMIAEQELNYQKAEAYYSDLIQIDSTNSYYFRKHALIAKKLGNLLKATALFNKAHSLNEQDIVTICDLATGYLELKSLDYAQQIIEKGLALDGENIRVLQTQARIKNAVENYSEVIIPLEKTRALGDSSNYYAMMLSVAYLKSDSLEQCISLLEKIVEQKKDSEHTHHYLALAYELKGELELSGEHFEKAIEKGISKKVPRYHKDLAALNERAGKYFKAYTHYQKAYEYSDEKLLLFHIAQNADRYFADKNIALRYYKKYLKSADEKYKAYSEQRAQQLREVLHFQK